MAYDYDFSLRLTIIAKQNIFLFSKLNFLFNETFVVKIMRHRGLIIGLKIFGNMTQLTHPNHYVFLLNVEFARHDDSI